MRDGLISVGNKGIAGIKKAGITSYKKKGYGTCQEFCVSA